MASEQSTGRNGDMELGRFLYARRTQTSPEQVGLTVGTGLRRTPGLRREELATLAGMSIDYYVRLERGKETRPSPSVLDALARALQLDEAERQHLRELATRAARYAPEPPQPSRTVHPHLKLVLETLRPSPAYIISRSMDLLAWNSGGLALYAGLDDWPATQRNIARYLFLHPTARTLFQDEWEYQVRGCVARLRAQAGIDPDAPDLTSLVGELLLKSPEFAKLWERYDVVGRKEGPEDLPSPAGRRPHSQRPEHAHRRHPGPTSRRLHRRTGDRGPRRHAPARPDRATNGRESRCEGRTRRARAALTRALTARRRGQVHGQDDVGSPSNEDGSRGADWAPSMSRRTRAS
jgi:transcriptional regulator with XRE-family HTH domain